MELRQTICCSNFTLRLKLVLISHGAASKCEGLDDVVGVKAPLGGVAQVIFHGVQVVEVGVQVRVHQDRGVEEDGEGQVEVEREEGEIRENRTSWMTCR